MKLPHTESLNGVHESFQYLQIFVFTFPRFGVEKTHRYLVGILTITKDSKLIDVALERWTCFLFKVGCFAQIWSNAGKCFMGSALSTLLIYSLWLPSLGHEVICSNYVIRDLTLMSDKGPSPYDVWGLGTPSLTMWLPKLILRPLRSCWLTL